MQLEKFGLEKAVAAALVKGVAESKYSLLTGAGFSIGASCQGGDIPSAKRFAEILNERFKLGLTISSAADLAIAYEDALDSDKGGVNNAFEEFFTGCKPSWQAVLSELDWRRIWTLNVDDLPESIWKNSQRAVHHLDFSERYKPVSADSDDLQVIYLHGRAATKRKKGGNYIFSITEYVGATKDSPPWHTAFFTEFSDRPFIMCGASAVGEFDLARTFRSGSQSMDTSGYPSIAVIKNLDEASSRRLKGKLNLIPLNVDGESFFSSLLADVKDYRVKNPGLLSPRAQPADARAFGNQFKSLEISNGVASNKRHDFHLGDEPEWSDIVGDADAQLSYAKEATAFILDALASGKIPVVCIVGDPGSGKSTTLLRILRNFNTRGCGTYLFRGEESLAVDSTIACLPSQTISVLGFDMAADFAADISTLIGKATARKLPAAIVIVDRLRRKSGILNDVNVGELKLIDHSKISGGDSLQIRSARERQHRLGQYVSLPANDFRKLITNKHGGNLFSALAEVEGGKGYYRRLDDHGDALGEDAYSMTLAHAISLTHRWGYSLPLRCASLVSKLEVSKLVALCSDDGALVDVFAIDSKGVRFRHRILADYYFDKFADRDVLYSVAKSIVETLAPLVNVDAIRSKSYPYLICRVLMARKSVLASVGSLNKARDFYRDLEEAFGHNSRFWEQRALLESEANNHAAAFSYAHEAVSREKHAFPLTTLGRICMAQALDMVATSTSAAFEKFKEGNAALLEARAVGANRPETLGHPFTCFFDYALRAYPTMKGLSGAAPAMKNMWDSWVMDAASTKVFRDSTELDSYRGKWMKVVLDK